MSGSVLRRFRLGPALVAAAGVQAAASATIGAGYSLASLIASFLCLGICAGMIDSSLSAAASLWSRHRLMNLLHASYGAGAALAPLAVTAAIVLSSWRFAYLTLGGLQLALAGWWWRHRPFEAVQAARKAADAEPARNQSESLLARTACILLRERHRDRSCVVDRELPRGSLASTRHRSRSRRLLLLAHPGRIVGRRCIAGDALTLSALPS